MAQTVRSTRRKAAKKIKRTLSSGQVHILATFNNTIVTVTDPRGMSLPGAALARLASKALAKARPLLLAWQPKQAIKAAMAMGLQEAELYVKDLDRVASLLFAPSSLWD